MRSRERADQQHHVVAAIQTLLHDTNSLDAKNTEALVGARKAVELIKELPPLVRFIPAPYFLLSPSSLFLLFLHSLLFPLPLAPSFSSSTSLPAGLVVVSCPRQRDRQEGRELTV